MTRQKDTAYGINRLESKNARAAIIQKISGNFHLMPLTVSGVGMNVARSSHPLPHIREGSNTFSSL